jgi:hypothetical protein
VTIEINECGSLKLILGFRLLLVIFRMLDKVMLQYITAGWPKNKNLNKTNKLS